LLSIRGEDAVTEKIIPFRMELWALAVIRELGGENRFGVLNICCEDDTR
jgi:hypothetical protein